MRNFCLAIAITVVGVACSSPEVASQKPGASPGDNKTSWGGPQPAESCSGRVCGSDSSGTSCGTCGGSQTCSVTGQCEAAVPAGVTCPATGSIGPAVGKVVKPGSFSLAQGGEYTIENNCAKPVYILSVTETCGICMTHLGQWTKAGGFFDQLKAAGVDVILVSSENPQGANGSVETAEAVRKRFNLGDRFILGYEPLGRDSFTSFIATRTRYAGARIALIVKPGNIIGAIGQVDEESEIRKALGLQ